MFKSRRHGETQSTDISSSQDNPSFHYIGWPCGCWWQEPVSHFLQTCFYGSDVQMPSGLDLLPVIPNPPWKVGAETLGGDQGHILNDPSGPLNLAPGGLLVSCHSSILLSRSPLPLPSPRVHLHSHYMSNPLFPEYVSLPYVPLSSSFNKARQTPTHLSNPKSFLFFQEAFPDYSNHLLFYSPAEQCTQLSHIT